MIATACFWFLTLVLPPDFSVPRFHFDMTWSHGMMLTLVRAKLVLVGRYRSSLTFGLLDALKVAGGLGAAESVHSGATMSTFWCMSFRRWFQPQPLAQVLHLESLDRSF